MVLQDAEKHRKLRNHAKTNVRQITKEQRKEVIEKGRKEEKEDFLRKIVNLSDITV